MHINSAVLWSHPTVNLTRNISEEVILIYIQSQSENFENSYHFGIPAWSTARNYGWSTHNVQIDWGVDWSTFNLASHVDRSHSIVLKMK